MALLKIGNKIINKEGKEKIMKTVTFANAVANDKTADRKGQHNKNIELTLQLIPSRLQQYENFISIFIERSRRLQFSATQIKKCSIPLRYVERELNYQHEL